MNKSRIRISVVSDVVCPWCYIGKRRLEKAVGQLKDQYEIEVEYLPFELNPSIPPEGYDLEEYLSSKFGGPDRYRKLTQHVSQVAAEEGLKLDYSRQKKSPNTFDAHRIIWLAGKEGKQQEAAEAFFKAYFEEGADLTQKETLVRIAEKAGMDGAKVKALLESNEGVDALKEQQLFNRQAGVTGVPFYIINNTYGVSGAQPSDVFVKVLSDIGKEGSEQGPSCDMDGEC